MSLTASAPSQSPERWPGTRAAAALDVVDVLARYDVTLSGLSHEEARRRRDAAGLNSVRSHHAPIEGHRVHRRAARFSTPVGQPPEVGARR